MQLALEEVVTNNHSYGYKGHTDKEVGIDFALRPGKLEMCAQDSAPPFNPLRKAVRGLLGESHVR